MPPRPRFDRRAPVRELPNINDRISYPQLRVVDADGSQLGVITREAALEVAKDRELDLVLVSEKADPPVCRIMDYGKFKFEQEKKAKEAESKRATLLFTVEKERANWVLEEDHLRRKISELEDQMQVLEQSKENLKKEVDRLRQDLRASGASSGGPPRKPFLFAKPAQGSPGLNQTQNSQGASKYLLNKSGQL